MLVNLNPNNTVQNNVWNTELVTITIPANTTPSRIQFPNVENLREVRLSRIRAYSLNEVSRVLGGGLVVPQNQLQFTFLTLQLYNGRQKIHQMPLSDIYSFYGNGVSLPNFVGQMIDWNKSYIEIEWSAGAAFPQDTSYVFEVEYYLTPEQELADLNVGFRQMK